VEVLTASMLGNTQNERVHALTLRVKQQKEAV
jgi:hypothetical protein